MMTGSAWPNDQRAATEVPRNSGHPRLRRPFSTSFTTVRDTPLARANRDWDQPSCSRRARTDPANSPADPRPRSPAESGGGAGGNSLTCTNAAAAHSLTQTIDVPSPNCRGN